MSRIEELPDDFDESLNLNDVPPEIAQSLPQPGFDGFAANNEAPFPINQERLKELEKDPSAPELPPAIAAVKSNSKEELLNMMNKTPLFMTDIENAGDENGENVLLDALHAMQNEGTRAEVAQSFKEQGNEAVQEKRWIDAKEMYTKSIAVIYAKEDKWDKPENLQVEQKLLRQMEELSHINRALCNLELGNYRSCTLDCAAVIKLNPKNVKAYYRSSMALLKLDKVIEAEDCVSRGLAIDSENKALQTASSKISERKAQVQRVAAKKKAEEELARKQNLVLSTALRARQIRTRKTDQPPEMEDAKISLVPDPLSPESTVQFPAVLLYPMDAQSDFIKSFSEMHTIEDHLDYIFPLPWDTKNEYSTKNVECFMSTVSGGLIKAGKRLPLLQILSGGKVEVVDELVRIFVVPISKTGAFIAEMKARKQG
ncbi:Tetratricopeptide-like helical [Penicillium macrosclerotiorum]|uniref:Tetratricopeptide-like helical n=1 Tax=Penicillium macrosclerotiorum TaxID=303699 RepID=UPI00254934FF|nr:Tetratricopeptide-like helical [Penicillium macrosclerotiorum]KAJ5679891.1 Tetratricopeptide-like helical [Penicillium macrosclerotiorum]